MRTRTIRKPIVRFIHLLIDRPTPHLIEYEKIQKYIVVVIVICLANSNLFPVEFLVQQENEQVHVDFGFTEHLHDGDTIVL